VEELAAPAETTFEAQERSTKYGAGISALISRTYTQRKTRPLAGWALIAGSFGWILALLFGNLSHQTLPWCTTFLLTSGATIAWLYGKSKGSALTLFKLGELRPLATSEGLAVSFIAFSCMLCALMTIYKFAPAVPVVRRQIVDIEFVSGSDAVDRHDILPGTVVKAQEKKVSSSASISSHGHTLSQMRVPSHWHDSNDRMIKTGAAATANQQAAIDSRRKSVAQQPLKSQTQAPSASTPRTVANNAAPNVISPIAARVNDGFKAPSMVVVSHPASFISPAPLVSQVPGGSHWQTQTIAPIKRSSARPARLAETMEEVAPPEMVELTDSQGESRANELWQAGGHSTGGSGSPSTLTSYLKELHHRIKHAWAPPVGETRTAEILFRIKRTGHLTSIKLVRSSGNGDADEAAMAAIGSCSPFRSLPADYTGEFLDLQYTFNYTADRLSEMPGHRM